MAKHYKLIIYIFFWIYQHFGTYFIKMHIWAIFATIKINEYNGCRKGEKKCI